MEVLAAIIGSAVTETGRSLYGCCPSIKDFISFQSNLKAVEKEMKSLLELRIKVVEDVDSSDAQTKQWLQEVEQIMIEVNSVQAGMTANSERLCGCFFTCSRRCRLGGETARMLKEIERLLNAASKVARHYVTKAVEHIPGPCIENQTTASKNLAKVMDLLYNNDVVRIGVWGMGGVGKTTLVKNLNNALKDSCSSSSSTSTQPFGIVIWATVSKKLDLRNVQVQLAERLNLDVKVGESVQRLAIRLHQRLQNEKFLLILDDVWETIDLDALGVPQLEVDSGSKIILTSRSLEVCREMKTDQDVKVDVLNDEESWQLFTTNAGKVATSQHIEPIARAVASECSGLPLAIITVGTAMRGKTMIELWKDALNELQRSVPCIKGIENKVFKPLKWSYDSLQGKNIKPCFLYCSLYPEDFSIDVSELVMCWLGEGLIDEHRNYDDSYNRGMAIIENLKDSCLLEHGARKGTVKMHDVIRDVAIWISSSMEDGCKSLVYSGVGLTRVSEAELSQSLKRVSFMHNRITELPDSGISCPQTVSLLLQGNLTLKRIPDGFLQPFQSLKVLNISRTLVQSLPESILQLIDLQVLILRGCVYLEELPQLGMFRKLQVLDCSDTRIRQLPSEMKSLSKLRQLYLSRTHNLRTIEGGIISGLSNLELLDMTLSAYIWSVKQETEAAQTTFTELLSLERLLVISIRLEGIPTLESRGQTWIGRLRRFQFIIGPYQTAFWQQMELVEKRVIIIGFNLLRHMSGLLLTNATSLVLDRCEGGEIVKMFGTKHIDCLPGLKSLTISNPNLSNFSEYLSVHVSKSDLIPNLEEFHVLDFEVLKSITELIEKLGICLSRLRILEITRCPDLKYLLQYDDPELNTEKLEVIKVSFCDELRELFQHTPGETKAPVSVVPTLRIIEVTKCDLLLKLPLRNLNPNSIEEIRGDELWWTTLEQDSEEDAKGRLQRFFKPVRAAKPQTNRNLTRRYPQQRKHKKFRSKSSKESTRTRQDQPSTSKPGGTVRDLYSEGLLY